MKYFALIMIISPWPTYMGKIHVQANLIITLSLGSIETDRVISEPCYNEVTFYRHIVK